MSNKPMTNEQAAGVLTELLNVAAVSQEPVTIGPVDEEAIQLAKVALRELERLRGKLRDIYGLATLALSEPEGTGELVAIATICEENGGDTTDPRDARIAELERKGGE